MSMSIVLSLTQPGDVSRVENYIASCEGWQLLAASQMADRKFRKFQKFPRPELNYLQRMYAKTPSIAKMTTATLTLPADYGYVCLVLFATVLVHHFYMSFSVGAARKKCVTLWEELRML